MINKTVMKALSQWDEPQMYEDINLYMAVSVLLVLLMHKDSAIELLSSEQVELLRHLVSSSMEATMNAFEKAEMDQQRQLIGILESLSNFAEEIESVSTVIG